MAKRICRYCDGKGVVRSGPGFTRLCSVCDGKGKVRERRNG